MTEYQCNDCGHEFTALIEVYDVRCQAPDCNSTNTEVVE